MSEDQAIELPDVQDQVIDLATLRRLFSDIELASELVGVSLKGGARERTSGESGTTLGEALEALASGSARGAQVRYLHQGREWWDTVMRAGEGYRLVRIEAPSGL